MREIHSLDAVGPAKLVQAAHVVHHVECETGLDCRDTGRVRLELPQALRLSQEPIQERLRVPVLGPVSKPRVAALSSLLVPLHPEKRLGISYTHE